MAMKREDFKVEGKYILGRGQGNIFTVLAKHKDYLWIEWVDDGDGDVESVYFELSELKVITEHT